MANQRPTLETVESVGAGQALRGNENLFGMLFPTSEIMK